MGSDNLHSGAETRIEAARLRGVYVGQPAPLGREGQRSALVKSLVEGPVSVGSENLAGDAQADRRVHGGPDKAVHQYSVKHYARWAATFPRAAEEFTRGCFGENISTDEHDEHSVCIGDRYRIGAVLLEVAQPRRPCWKLDHRFEVDGLAQAVHQAGLAGWYFRVLETGEISVGMMMTLESRPRDTMTLAAFWAAYHADRPDVAMLERMRELPGLAANWLGKLDERIDWLAKNA